jgi:hypothetical protein
MEIIEGGGFSHPALPPPASDGLAYTLVNKTVYVDTSNFGFIAENLRILKFCLIKYYVE